VSRLVEYCNITTDLQNVYTGIELFAKQTVNNGKFSTVLGKIYSRMGESGYVGQLSIDREVKTVAASLADINTTNVWYYANNVLYVLTSVIGTNDITIASDTWENIKETAREDASQEIENFLYMYNRPLPFRKNADEEYDRDIVRACAYLTCARIIEMSNPEDMLADKLRKMVWNDETESGLVYDYTHDKKKYSFEATTQSYNGNVIPNASNTGAGQIELAGISIGASALIAGLGLLSTLQFTFYSWNKDKIVSLASIIIIPLRTIAFQLGLFFGMIKQKVLK